MESSTMSLAEKRRNKLGYHRTSIACSHCRRRKIRCLLDEKDPHGRCSNCIRLKKECNFFPVDQQPPVERRARTGSKAEGSSMDADTSSTSSPGRASGSIDQVDKFSQHSQQFTPISEAGWNPAFSSMSGSPAGRGGPLPTRNFSDFPSAFDSTSSWDSPTYLSHSPLPMGAGKPRTEEQPQYWRMADSPSTMAYLQSQPYPPAVSGASYTHSAAPSYSNPGLHEDGAWAPQQSHVNMRSMSIGGGEEMSSPYQNYHYASFPSTEPKRRPTSDLQSAPSLHGSGTSSAASTNDSHGPPPLGAFSGPQLPSQSGPYPQYQGWGSYADQQHLAGSHEAFGSWYPNVSQAHQPAVTFAESVHPQYPELHGGYSGPG